MRAASADRRVASWRTTVVVDALVALGLLAVSLPGFVGAGAPGLDDLPPLAPVLAVLHVGALAARRARPEPALALSGAAGAVYVLVGYPLIGLGLAPLVLAYSTGAELAPARARLAVALVVGLGVIGTEVIGSYDVFTTIGNTLALTVSWLLGDSARRRRESARRQEERADALEATRDEAVQRATAEERLRIARELHDVVAHGLSVIAVQAGAARMVVEDDPERVRAALADIEATTRQALREMRQLLGVLREDGETAGDRAPLPSLGDIDPLVADAAAHGLAVQLETHGERRRLSPGAELAAYRIVQEALTNVRKHAPGADAHVVLRYGAGGLEIHVTNRVGATVPASLPGAGHGIIGMTERATSYGGWVKAKPTGDGGFEVRAMIPEELPS